MISKEFYKLLEGYAVEKNIELDLVLEAFTKGLINAYKREYNNSYARVEFKKEKNEINMFSRYKVVSDFEKLEHITDAKPITLIDAKNLKKYAKIGDVFEIAVPIKEFRRMAVSNAKQVFTQNIKDHEKEELLKTYNDYEHEILTLPVIEITKIYIRLRIDEKNTTTIKVSELIPQERITRGDNLTVYVKKIDNTKKGVFLDLTRISPKLIVRLLEKNIPEIAEGVIEIKGISRDAGRLTKICVISNNKNVDAVGSIIGERGSRIQKILDEIKGEKIELFNYTEDPKTLVANALQPVSVLGFAHLDEVEKKCIVVVPDDQVSLAIGKKGSNIRLLLETTGYNSVEIKSETQAKEENLTW